MLYVPPEAQKPKHVQGVFVSDPEIDAVVKFWTADRFAELVPEKYDELLHEAERQVEEMTEEGLTADADPMLHRAIELAREHRSLSTSLLQRKLRVGYPRAARLMDDLESRGIVGAGEGSGGSREVLAPREPGAEPESLAAAAAAFQPPSSVRDDGHDAAPPTASIVPEAYRGFPRPFDSE
jgi:DNA segregation ATPase FtsK/SpoIIIE, S-DNA-T family